MNDSPIDAQVIEPEKETKYSPKPILGMDFSTAIRKVIDGQKIARVDWKERGSQDYGVLENGFLMLHKTDGFHQWMVSEGDLLGIDWVVVQSN